MFLMMYFAFTAFAPGSTSCVFHEVAKAVCCQTSPLSGGESVTEYFPDGPFVCSECCAVFESVADEFVFDSVANGVRSGDIVVEIPSSLVITDSAGPDRLW